MRSGSADFVRSFLLVSAGLLGGMALLNRAVDPYGVYGGFPAETFRDIQVGGGTRISKAELVRHFRGSTYFVGSSRVEVAYNPESQAIPDGPMCNLGISGTNFYELSYVLDYILKQPQLRRIVLFLDFQQFTAARGVNCDFDLSRFNTDLSSFDYHCNVLLRKGATRLSLKTLDYYFRGRQDVVSALGYRRPAAMATDQSLANRAHDVLRWALQDPEVLGGFQYSPDRLASLRRFVRKCRDADVDLIVVIQPTHATMLESFRCAGLWDTHETWIRDVVRLVAEESESKSPVWDFTSFGLYTTEPLLTATEVSPDSTRWFWEPSHCKVELGELILRRIFHRPGADPSFGAQLTCDGLPEHFAQIRSEREAWLQSCADEAQVVQQVARDAGFNVNASIAATPAARSIR